MLEEIVISAPKVPPPKPLIVVWSEYCKNDPPPIFCELPDDLKDKTFSFPNVGNNSNATTTASGVSGSINSTSTT